MSKIFTVQIISGARTESISLSSDRFRCMNWAMEAIPSAIIYPRSKEHVCCAIQELSGDIPIHHCYSHTGWIEHHGQPIFLHSKGAISADGPVHGIDVRLPSDLALYALPNPPPHDELHSLIPQFNSLLRLAPDEVILPLIAAVFRAPLGNCNFSLFISGMTGAGKTQLISIASQFFGSQLHAGNLPASYASTANALESHAFLAKDVFFAIDDYIPGATRLEQQRMAQVADRVIRGQGNRVGRQRMNKTLDLQPGMYPRGLIGSTGEDLPPGQSLRARLLHIELKRRDINFDLLSSIQQYAIAGIYSTLMSGYIRGLAGLPTLQTLVERDLPKYRREFADSNAHRRTAEILANLAIGFSCMLEYLKNDCGLSSTESDMLHERMIASFKALAQKQLKIQKDQDPALRSIEALEAAIAAGTAHLESIGKPLVGRSESSRANRIGWYDATGVYLISLAAFRIAEQMLGGPGSLSVSEKQWRKHLSSREFLYRESSKDSLLVRKSIFGTLERVLHLKPGVLNVDVQHGPDEARDDI